MQHILTKANGHFKTVKRKDAKINKLNGPLQIYIFRESVKNIYGQLNKNKNTVFKMLACGRKVVIVTKRQHCHAQ